MSHAIEQFHFEAQEAFEEYLSNESLNCSICMSVPKQAHTSTACCGMMILCAGCINTYYKGVKTQCPTCNKRGVLLSHFVVNMRAQKTINALRAKCIGCDYGLSEEKTLENVLVHQEKACENRRVVCKHCQEDVPYKNMEQHMKESCMTTCKLCADIVYSSYFEEHTTSWCNKRLVDCEQGCKEKVRWCDMQRHIDTQCAKTLLTCHRNCGASYLRYEYGLHEVQCGLVLISCPDCPHRCERKNMREHVNDKMLHMEYKMTKMVADMTAGMEKMVTELKRVSDENAKMCAVAPLFLPRSIKVIIKGKEETMVLADLPRHYCDFCNDGKKSKIPLLFGKNYGYHFGNVDMCLHCARLTMGITNGITNGITAATATATANAIQSVIPSRNFQFNITSLNAGNAQYKEGIVVHKSHINMVGCYVTEGPDWRWANQAGPSKTGTIVEEAETPGWVRVKWHTAENGEPISNTYRIGADNKFDLSYINADDSRIPRTF